MKPWLFLSQLTTLPSFKQKIVNPFSLYTRGLLQQHVKCIANVFPVFGLDGVRAVSCPGPRWFILYTTSWRRCFPEKYI